MSAMKERSIVLSGPMVRAILGGRKTQMRRLVRFPCAWSVPSMECGSCQGNAYWGKTLSSWDRCACVRPVGCPYGKLGDRLWVREAWAAADDHDPDRDLNPGGIFFRATHSEGDLSVRWRSPIHMPRWASRLTLVVTDVRVQRVREISEQDALAEGWRFLFGPGMHFRTFDSWWDGARRYGGLGMGKRAPWASNPWVWAITFEPVSRPLDNHPH